MITYPIAYILPYLSQLFVFILKNFFLFLNMVSTKLKILHSKKKLKLNFEKLKYIE